jgi:hypothetical protein
MAYIYFIKLRKMTIHLNKIHSKNSGRVISWDLERCKKNLCIFKDKSEFFMLGELICFALYNEYLQKIRLAVFCKFSVLQRFLFLFLRSIQNIEFEN